MEYQKVPYLSEYLSSILVNAVQTLQYKWLGRAY